MIIRQVRKYLILSCLLVLAALPALAQGINKKPLQDFAANLDNKIDKDKIDLTKPFSVTLEGYLTEDGKFDLKRSKFTKFEGDPKMVEVGKSAIIALGDSGMLGYLRNLGVEKIRLDLSQDENTVATLITSEQSNENKARTIASGFNLLLNLAKVNTKEEEAQTFIRATRVTADGKNFIINCAVPRDEFHQLPKNELQKAKEKGYSSKVD